MPAMLTTPRSVSRPGDGSTLPEVSKRTSFMPFSLMVAAKLTSEVHGNHRNSRFDMAQKVGGAFRDRDKGACSMVEIPPYGSTNWCRSHCHRRQNPRRGGLRSDLSGVARLQHPCRPRPAARNPGFLALQLPLRVCRPASFEIDAPSG